MIREDYIKYRTENSMMPLYEFYKENFNEEKHKTFLGIEEFFAGMGLWEHATTSYHKVIAYYDVKFIIMKILNLSTGTVIKYL